MDVFHLMFLVNFFITLFVIILLIILNRNWFLVKFVNCFVNLIEIFGGKKALEDQKDNINCLYDLIEKRTGILNPLRKRITLDIRCYEKDLFISDYPEPAIEGYEDVTHLLPYYYLIARPNLKAYRLFFTSNILTFNPEGEIIKDFDKIVIISDQELIPSVRMLDKINVIKGIQRFDLPLMTSSNFPKIPTLIVYCVFNRNDDYNELKKEFDELMKREKENSKDDDIHDENNVINND